MRFGLECFGLAWFLCLPFRYKSVGSWKIELCACNSALRGGFRWTWRLRGWSEKIADDGRRKGGGGRGVGGGEAHIRTHTQSQTQTDTHLHTQHLHTQTDRHEHAHLQTWLQHGSGAGVRTVRASSGSRAMDRTST